jgi:hypothetical protein
MADYTRTIAVDLKCIPKTPFDDLVIAPIIKVAEKIAFSR